MKQKYIDYYMDVADRTSKLSDAIRRQVGAVIVKDNRILSYGYNGMPTGWPNECEYRDYLETELGSHLTPDEIKKDWPFEETRGAEQGKKYEYQVHSLCQFP